MVTRTYHRYHILTPHFATHSGKTFVEHQPRKPRRERCLAAKTSHRSVGAHIRVLQRVLRFGSIAQRGAREPVQPAVVEAHQTLERTDITGRDAADERSILARGCG